MGLLLGEFMNELTIKVVDVFAMPQKGSTVTIEDVDSVFQARMMGMLRETGRTEMVVGWYHSHPGYGCWLSHTDQNTQKAFEKLDRRAVAIVIDSILSVRGKVIIDAFRLLDQTELRMMGIEARQTTSNLGLIKRPTLHGLIRGLNRSFYSMLIECRKTEVEEAMLLNLHKKPWAAGFLADSDHVKQNKDNLKAMNKMKVLSEKYETRIMEESMLTPHERSIRYVGRPDPKKHLEDLIEVQLEENIVHLLGRMMKKASLNK